MNLPNNYDEMPKLYREVYYNVRSMQGKELFNFVSKTLRSIDKKRVSPSLKKEISEDMIHYIEEGVLLSERELISQLLNFKYSDEIHPEIEKFRKYVSKTRTSTTVETRKKIREIFFNTEFFYAWTKEELLRIKALFKEINIEKIMEEIESLDRMEEERILTYQKGAVKRKKYGTAINFELERIAPLIIKDLAKEKTFFTELKFRKKNIGFFIKPDIGKDREIVSEYLKKAFKSQQLLIDLDNENENFFICFDNDDDLAFMRSIISQRFLQEPLEGVKILGIPIQVIITKCQYKNMDICEPEWHELNFNQYYESIKRGVFAFTNRIKFSKYSDTSVRMVIEELMEQTQFESEIYLACYLHFKYLLPLQIYVDKREVYFEKNDIHLSIEEFKLKKENIYRSLIVRGESKTKWKNEVDLYKLVVKNYPDAVFQFRAEWLGRQSLDIYIPSIKTAFEYQGEQHYKPVEFFGGNEAFLYRQKLDAEKLNKCNENGVRLIEWSYQDIISQVILKRKINN